MQLQERRLISKAVVETFQVNSKHFTQSSLVLKSLVMLKCIYCVAHIGLLKLTILEQSGHQTRKGKKKSKSTGVIKK